MQPHGIRKSTVAGMFYPGDPGVLRRDVDRMLDAAVRRDASGVVCAMVSPHAGYPYSGAIAACGFRQLREHDVRTLVMIGPSHVEYFNFSSVFTGDAYETPLGAVAVDVDLAKRIAASHETIRESNHGHVQPDLQRGEHGLEVQLPFLQRTHPNAMIVPIVMGEQNLEQCIALGKTLAAECGPQDVILASSDLSHFHDYDTAVALDRIFLDTLSALDAPDLFDAVRELKCEACGAGPVVASLVATDAPDRERRYSLLAHANSGDVAGDRNSVVGYASAVITTGAEDGP